MNERNGALLEKAQMGEQPEAQMATFIHIRAVEGDMGERPLAPGTVCWLSPDVELFDARGVRITTSQLAIGEQYTVRVTVSNGGDHDSNSCMVELYLDDPSVGFNVAASVLLGSQTVAVPARGQRTVNYPFVATSATVGHKCLFARAYSLLSNDFPKNWTSFDVLHDRHVGQQNIDIVHQGTAFDFGLGLGAGGQRMPLNIRVRRSERIPTSARIPAVGGYVIADRQLDTSMLRLISQEAKVVAPRSLEGKLLKTPANGVELDAGNGALGAVDELIGNCNEREKRCVWSITPVTGLERFRLEIPHLDLGPNEVVPMDIEVTNRRTGKIIGGFTLLVVGARQ
jgi:hypothetical protein